MPDTTRREQNSLILSVYLFQYSLLMPLMQFLPPTPLVAGISASLLLVLFLLNGWRLQFHRSQYIFLAVLFLLIGIKFIVGSPVSLLFFGTFIPLSAMVCFSYPLDYKHILKYCYYLAYLNFLINAITPLISAFDRMRYGYAMLLTPIFILLNLQYKVGIRWRLMDCCASAASILLMLLYGGRGPFLAFLLFLVGYLFFFSKIHFAVISGVLITAAVLVYHYIVELLELMQRIVDYFGIHSYSLMKYQLQLRQGFEAASSGRAALYQASFEKCKENFWFGTDIDLTEIYVHNLFLQVMQDFGFIGIVLLLLLLFKVARTVLDKRADINARIFLFILGAVSLGRLLVSSTYWLRPEFWLMLACALVLEAKRPKKVKAVLIELPKSF